MTETIIDQYIPKIGEGVFLTKDVAQILKLPYRKVRYCIADFWDAKFSNQQLQVFGEKRNRAVNFHTLIEFYTFYQLKIHGFKTKQIKAFHDIISKGLNTKYPFAYNISTDGKSVWFEHLENLIKADKKNQFDIRPFLEPFLSKIEFDSNDKIAQRFYPLEASKNIVVDPQRQFGQPIIAGRNIKAVTIKNLFDGGESKESICSLYDLKAFQVEDALKYYQNIA